MIDALVGKIKGEGTRIVSTEGSDPRVLEVMIRPHKENIAVPVPLGNRAEVAGSTATNGWDIESVETLDPIEYKSMDIMATKVIELRKDKLNEAQAGGVCLRKNFFNTMCIKLDYTDSLLGGVTCSAADTIRPALQLIKTRPGNSIVPSCSILMENGKENLAMGDCSISINPSADDLAEVTLWTTHAIRQSSVELKVGLLSYFTPGSAEGVSAAEINGAATHLKRIPLDFAVEDEVQFDYTVAPEVAKLKVPDSKVAGNIGTFIFPDIGTGSIGYEIASRLGGYEATGSILQGLSAPISDLFRGYNAEEVFKVAIVTVAWRCMGI